jgi:hypothetical protein
MKILYLNENPDLTKDRLAPAGELTTDPPMTDPVTFSAPDSTSLLDRLAPHWQLRLYDGAVIDHILNMINRPRPSRSHEARQSSPRFPGSLPPESLSDQRKEPA